ncbi:fungal-specific transcription factor domain-containing protein [Trichoderma velutinum]
MQYPGILEKGCSEPWAEAAVTIAKMSPGAPNAREIEHLVSYYSRKIAGNMIWVDSPSNPYRRLVVPKAKSSPIILLAILAVSAEHMGATEPLFRAFAPKACDIVVSNITYELSRVTEGLGCKEPRDILDLETVEWILASMLILSNYECIGDASAAWCSHRLGARLLINAYSGSGAEASELFRFLRAQFGIYDVLASTTTWVYLGLDDVVLPIQGDPEALLSEYIRLIHQLTIYITRKTPQNIPVQAALRIEFEETRDITLMNAATSGVVDGKSTRLTFIHLVDVHHLAGLLYAYRCVYRFTSQDTEISLTTLQLFEKLQCCASNDALIQHLTWPVFIAGTECYNCEERQHLVLKWYGDIINKTGFRNYEVVVSFLKELWKDRPKSWLEMAKIWERDGKPLLAV